MLAYLATKEQFLLDAPDIEDIVKAAVVKGLNLHPSESEFNSWRNSLGNAMFHVMNNQTIPSDALIAVEYRMNGRAIRLDFIVAGKDKSENEVLLVVELKQWTNVDFAEKNDHVNTFLGKGIRSVVHPSYQAWSYKSHLESYNEYIYENKVKVLACAYLHNMPPNKVITDSRYENYLAMAPVFLDKDRKKLQEFILDQIAYGVDREFIEKVDGAKIIPSKELADSVKTMLNGKNEFVLLDDQKSAYEEIIYRQSIATSTQKQVVLIKGGPGTGKSVIAINALATLVGNQVNTKIHHCKRCSSRCLQSEVD